MKIKVRETIAAYNMLESGDNVIVGVSGGADSIALLHTLDSLKEELGITIYACHINHNLRGAESQRDESFVRNFCREKNIPLEVFSVDVKGNVEKHESIEERARKIRYACFERLCKERNAKLVTAHTASDNAETVFINILRGTGTKGLGGIPPIRGNIIRPLLRCTREDIERYCTENKLEYVTDSSNLSDDYTRNKLRHHLIPMLKEFNPSVIEAITRMTSAVYDDNAYIENAAMRAKTACATEDGYSCISLCQLERPILCRIISSVLSENDIEPSSLRINECVQIITDKKGKINLCRNKFAVVRKKIFKIQYEEQNYRNKSI